MRKKYLVTGDWNQPNHVYAASEVPDLIAHTYKIVKKKKNRYTPTQIFYPSSPFVLKLIMTLPG